ncbi:hypothetical protein V6N12_062697 [Hibiscus sabdariffa]|uniref:Uncharacterized protein n=1 Tax=Hibiscus sabdariffa TaxID=183260 RepID=A0ABR2F9L8_9ROSI
MIMPSANLMENPLKSHKNGKSHDLPKAKGMSSFAFLFSIAIYISIFYIFSLSPSTLFSNPKFWFAISNTLILIIAADYGAFASSKDRKLDLYDEYALHGQARRTHSSTSAAPVPSFVSQYPGIVKEEADVADQKKNEIPVRMLDEKLQQQQQQQNPMKAEDEACDHQAIKPQTIRRSKSGACHGKKNNLQRSKTERLDEPVGQEKASTAEDDQNEFSTMSDEELNRRVEEFIQKFNRQIRLQGVRNRQVLQYECE